MWQCRDGSDARRSSRTVPGSPRLGPRPEPRHHLNRPAQRRPSQSRNHSGIRRLD
ncbi:UNVERIFIED_CONTAM: hypothetical protein GTU68_010922 [Idotea baltica]|nr:hypothetical protein [Idotea baltica]